MREIGQVWPEQMQWVTSRASDGLWRQCRSGGGRMQWLTMSQGYMVDRGAARQELSMPHVGDAHFDNVSPASEVIKELCVIMFGEELLDEDKTSWLQIQGPGWSDEYIGEAGPSTWKPRMDLRRALLGFLHFRMPRPSRWERVERARLVEALAATPGVYANFTALHAHVLAALTKVHGHESSSWSMESVGEQCSVAATQQW